MSLRNICLIVISILLLGVPACGPGAPDSLKIGVLLPLTGPNSLDSREVLDWAAAGLNEGGGIGGIPVELVYRDTYEKDILAIARELADNQSIQIVIGPQKSSDIYTIAPLFIEKNKLLISPMATSGDLLRAFAGKGVIWRTCQSDVAQVRSILYELDTRNVTRLSLIYFDDDYGKTFLEWTGFFCTELGIDLVDTVGFDQTSSLAEIMDAALIGRPEYIVTAAYSQEAVELKKLLDAKNTGTRLFFTDTAETPYLIAQLGAASEGVELMSPAADPESGFETSYRDEFGYYPWDYAAPTYDAFLLATYTLARQEYQRRTPHSPKESTEESFKKIITGEGAAAEWNETAKAVSMILQGELPDVNGASSPLRFDRESGVDPTESFYSLNRVETWDGETDFRTIRRFSSSESAGVGLLGEGTSAVSTKASRQYQTLDRVETALQFADRENLWAVIISTSNRWENYRHQSDALAVYSLLKDNGVSDDKIILFSVDDVPWMEENPLKGDIHHEVNGGNLREKAEIDYTGDEVNQENLKNVLLGIKSAETPAVLESSQNSNVLVYVVGHGASRILGFEYGEKLTSAELAQIVDEMYFRNRYRQMLMITEVCYGESLAAYIDTPGFLYLTGASEIEFSFGAVYDQNIKQWLADDFTRRVLEAMSMPGTTLEELYLSAYNNVTGSHVRLVNYENFGGLKTPVAEFITP